MFSAANCAVKRNTKKDQLGHASLAPALG